MTPDDVIFSFEAFKKHHPQLSAYYRHVTKAEKTGEREITFTFDGPGNRELPQIVGQFKVLPKHWWEGTDASGKKRDVSGDHAGSRRSAAAPIASRNSSPAAPSCSSASRTIGRKDLNVNIGRDNFDEIRYEYFRDSIGGARSLQGRHARLAHRELGEGLGDRATIFPP